MKILLTGGAGFIGRWLAKEILEAGHDLWIVDDLSNGCLSNLNDFNGHRNLQEVVTGDIKNRKLLADLFTHKFDLCYHLGASINVQDSIDNPQKTFANDVEGTFNVLEYCRQAKTSLVFMSTCMVYDKCVDSQGISEIHPIKPASPYAGSKIAGENMVLSYYHAYGLPTIVIRPFNTYGPYQKTNGEGGVVAIFIKRDLNGEVLNIYGDGTQTRDLLYVEDCAKFVYQAGFSNAFGQIVNAGSGQDIAIKDLAKLIATNPEKIRYIPHIHPQSEISKLLCNFDKARDLMDWEPKFSLEEGILQTRKWIIAKTEEGEDVV